MADRYEHGVGGQDFDFGFPQDDPMDLERHQNGDHGGASGGPDQAARMWTPPVHQTWPDPVWPLPPWTMPADLYAEGVGFTLDSGRDATVLAGSLQADTAALGSQSPSFFFDDGFDHDFHMSTFDPDAVALPGTQMEPGNTSLLPGHQLADHSFHPYVLNIPQTTFVDPPHQTYNQSFEQHHAPASQLARWNNPTPTRKKQRRLKEKEAVVLRNWFYLNLDYPYPDDSTMSTLQQQTELTVSQIRSWLSRTRQRSVLADETFARYLSRIDQARSRRGSSGSSGSKGKGKSVRDLAQMSLESLNCHHGTTIPYSITDRAVASFQSDGGQGASNPDPLPNQANKVDIDSWLNGLWLNGLHDENSPPTITIDTTYVHQPRQTLQVEAASMRCSPVLSASPAGLVPDTSDAASDVAGSITSMHTFRSGRSSSSFRSARSHQSGNSASSYGSRGARKGRRRIQTHSHSPSQASSLLDIAEGSSSRSSQKPGDKSLYCSACQISLSCAYTFKRHLKTIHAQETKPWLCQMVLEGEGQPYCIFCHFEPSAGGCIHRIHACDSKPEAERFYWRRDQFMQHLKVVHKVDNELVHNWQIDLDQWRVRDDHSFPADWNESVAPQFSSSPFSRVGTGERVRQTLSSVSKKLTFGYGTSRKR